MTAKERCAKAWKLQERIARLCGATPYGPVMLALMDELEAVLEDVVAGAQRAGIGSEVPGCVHELRRLLAINVDALRSTDGPSGDPRAPDNRYRVH